MKSPDGPNQQYSVSDMMASIKKKSENGTDSLLWESNMSKRMWRLIKIIYNRKIKFQDFIKHSSVSLDND